jgi:glycosyltransferase involved in cell wall biosynthesis
MACGCPVISSNCCSLSEVVGDAGILFDPADENSLPGLMENLIRSPGLRDTLSMRGMKRAHNFSWEKSAQEITAVYQRFKR